MLVWFIYDIVKDKPRKELADKALDLGLKRVQKSVYLGRLEETLADELLLFSEKKIDPEDDSVYLFPMCQEDFKKVEIRGKAFDKARANDELKTMFL